MGPMGPRASSLVPTNIGARGRRPGLPKPFWLRKQPLRHKIQNRDRGFTQNFAANPAVVVVWPVADFFSGNFSRWRAPHPENDEKCAKKTFNVRAGRPSGPEWGPGAPNCKFSCWAAGPMGPPWGPMAPGRAWALGVPVGKFTIWRPMGPNGAPWDSKLGFFLPWSGGAGHSIRRPHVGLLFGLFGSWIGIQHEY